MKAIENKQIEMCVLSTHVYIGNKFKSLLSNRQSRMKNIIYGKYKGI